MPVSDHQQTTNAAAWFVIEANENGGDKAQLALAVAGLTIWRPFDVKRDPTRGRHGKPRRDIRTARFGRYFFIRCAMTDDLAAAVRTTTGVASILCACGSNEPAAVPDEQIAWLREHRTAAAINAATFTKGDRVKFKDGPFAGLEALVRGVDKRGAMQVEVEIFGAMTPTIAESGAVELVQGAKSRAILAPGGGSSLPKKHAGHSATRAR
jgi:transcription antitermination factor NusG